MTITRLAVFDFDGTLFRSPEKPADWPHPGFWGRLETLSPPLVPEVPGREWYVPEVVAAAVASQLNPGTHTALITGRVPKFEKRVTAILENVGVSLDEYHFTAGAATLPFKVATLEGLMARFPDAMIVQMWDDRAEYLYAFRETIAKAGRVWMLHKIESTPMEFLRAS